jgi:SAM-dependent methyltransferase
MRIEKLDEPPYNEHYVGDYDARMIEWRKLGAADKARNIKSTLQGAQVNSVLEVGCGTGAVLLALKDLEVGAIHYGVDISDPSTHCDPGATLLNLAEYDGLRLPFDDSSVDLVFASHVIEHALEPRSLLVEMARVARHLVYVEVPCEANLTTNYARLQRSLKIGHINLFTPETLHLLVATSSLSVLRLSLFDHSAQVYRHHQKGVGRFLMRIVRFAIIRINDRLGSRLFTYHCGLLAEPRS